MFSGFRSRFMAVGVAVMVLARHTAVGDPCLEPKLTTYTSSAPCWVFTHMNKAGGTTIKYMLSKWGEEYRRGVGLYSGGKYSQGEQYIQAYWDKGNMVTMGGYAEALRSRVAGQCTWFTMFRHPLDRLISAYMYCRSPRVVEPLCGAGIIEPLDVDIGTFAEHWGNYGMRQFALSFVPPDVVLNSPFAQECPRCPPWYLVKDYLKRLQNSSSDEADGGLLRFVEPVMDIISHNYTAVGVLEDFDASLQLFDEALHIPCMDWEAEFREYGVRNGFSHRYPARTEKVIAEAKSDIRVKKAIQLDLALYEHALRIHGEQLVQYGLR